MLFSSTDFIFAFLPVVLGGYILITYFDKRILVFGWLVLCSLFFYTYWDPPFVLLLILSISINYLIGNILLKDRSKKFLIAGIVFNLGLIGIFKYFSFFVSTINLIFPTSLIQPSIILPLAISFFTFQQIAYLVDTYKGNIKDTNLLQYTFFDSFFPQLIAGPIVRYGEIISQFSNRQTDSLTASNFLTGTIIFIIGLQKKLVLADGIGVHADGFFSNLAGQDPTLIESWIGTLAYTFQIYFDFSGYSDMAIGLSRIFGIKLPENFNSPYKATNIIEFWRRWHMTLSRFLRDYLYIPCGGNRKGPGRHYTNIMITMLLGGLWHGAAWTFVFWGGLHGLFLVINHLWRAGRELLRQDLGQSSPVGQIVSRTITLLAIIFAWVFFRAESWSDALSVIQGMIGLNGVLLPTSWTPLNNEELRLLSKYSIYFVEKLPYQSDILINLVILGFIVLAFPNTRKLITIFSQSRTCYGVSTKILVTATVIVFTCISLLIVLARGFETNNFIYMVF